MLEFCFSVILFIFDSLTALRQDVIRDDAIYKHQQFELGPKASEGYGGRFGVHKDRMDQVQWGHRLAIYLFILIAT